MGAHSRPRGRTPGLHRGASAPILDLAGVSSGFGKAAGVAGLAVTAAVTLVAAAPAASAAPAGGGDSFAALRQCESSGNYAINTGNGFYGAYQFDIGTWQGLGYSGLPSSAAPATQDQAAQRLQAQRGWSPWPACSARLGLNGTTPQVVAAAAPAYTPPVTVRSAPAPRYTAPSYTSFAHAPRAKAEPAPRFDGRTLDVSLIGSKRADVSRWQQRMVDRGWHLRVDGYFGPQSAHIAAAFAVEKKLTSTQLGRVDATVWRATWTAPVTP